MHRPAEGTSSYKLPLYDGEDFVTTQSIGYGSFVPLNVYNRQRFFREVEQLGYQLWGEWRVPERSISLLGHPEKSVESLTGLYFVDRKCVLRKSRCPLSNLTGSP